MIEYRNATLEDVQEVAKVHILTQPEYFTSTLGEDLLSKFYSEYIKEDALFVVAIDEDNKKIVGFCMGHYYDSHAELLWEQKYRKQIIKRLAFKCIQFNKLALSRCMRRLVGIFRKGNENTEQYFSHLLSLGVLTEYRGKHIASDLIDMFEKKCLENPPEKVKHLGYDCTIGAYKWNKAGCKLYEYKGYEIFEESKTKFKFRKNLNPEMLLCL